MKTIFLLAVLCFQEGGFVVRPPKPNPTPQPAPGPSQFIVKPPVKKVAKSVVKAPSKEQHYTYKIRRGYSRGVETNVDGDWNPSYSKLWRHLVKDHAANMPKEITLDQMSYEDLWAIHCLIHSIERGRIAERRLGYWDNPVCPTDGGPCVQTWVWELP